MSFVKHGPNFLKGIREFRVAPGLTSEVVLTYLQSLDCPRALTAYLLYESGEHKQLSELSFDPAHYLTVDELESSYLATKFLSKASFLETGSDLDKVAMEKFESFELLCRNTNSRFRNLGADPNYHGSAVWLHHAVTRKISKILGEFSIEEFVDTPDWGPGASTLIKRRDASPAHKFQYETGITRDLYALCSDLNLWEYYPLWAKRLSENGFPNFQVGNKVVTVPKDATTNRVIAIEPGINLWFQMSLGKMIGGRLRRYGIDLRYQSRNQQLAEFASSTGELATVDLSSASDSISVQVVRELIPPEWFDMLDLSRSHYGSQNGSFRKWEKFSSMGNGFTFQLETLIFYAIATSVCERMHVGTADVSVYGDDVILPSQCFEAFSEAMSFYGFQVNVKKSHFLGYFRESCGVHFFRGVDVKPIYLKDKLSTVQTVYRLANAIRRLSRRRSKGLFCDNRFLSTWSLLFKRVPKALRLLIPDVLGDGGFVVNFDEASPTRCKHGIEGYLVPHLADLSLTKEVDYVGLLLSQLWSLEKSSASTLASSVLIDEVGVPRPTFTTTDIIGLSLSNIATHNSVALSGRLRPTVIRSVVKQWDFLGPWT